MGFAAAVVALSGFAGENFEREKRPKKSAGQSGLALEVSEQRIQCGQATAKDTDVDFKSTSVSLVRIAYLHAARRRRDSKRYLQPDY